MIDDSTIAACITPWGHGAVSVVRVSGPRVVEVIRAVCGVVPPARFARHVRLRDHEGVFDDGLVVVFPGPRSYTGEDVAEISCHGNPLLVERLLRALDVRPARPGEFTRRAFLNGRVDLARAEAVMHAIEARSRGGLDLARAGLDGAVSEALHALRLPLADVAAELEAILDYPGEDLLFDDDTVLCGRLLEVGSRARQLAAGERAGRFAVEGARVVLAGAPNAGKSSLFNALLGMQRAIVSPVAGTTRDSIEAPWQVERVRITLVDTAGERETDDAIEAAGVARTGEERSLADLVVHCLPLHSAVRVPLPADGVLVVGTFADQGGELAIPLRVSARTGAGLDALRAAILAALGIEESGARPLLASARLAEVCLRVASCAEDAARALPAAGPAAAAECIYAAIEALDEGTGAGAREDVLDRLFARFCVGK